MKNIIVKKDLGSIINDYVEEFYLANTNTNQKIIHREWFIDIHKNKLIIHLSIKDKEKCELGEA